MSSRAQGDGDRRGRGAWSRWRARWVAVVTAVALATLPVLVAPAPSQAAPVRPTAPTGEPALGTVIRIDGVSDSTVVLRGSAAAASAATRPVRVRVDGDVTRLVVTLNGHPVTGHDGRYVLGGSPRMRLGQNQVWVEATLAGRRRPAVASRTFFVGHRSPRLVSAAVRSRAGAPAALAQVRLPGGRIQRTSAWVDGRRFKVPLRDGTGRRVTWNLAQLTRLSPGRHRMRVEVLMEDGRAQRLTRSFRVDGRRHLAVARVRSARTHVGVPLVVDASASRLGRSRDRAVRWTLVRRPMLSRAGLGRAEGSGVRSRVQITPDVPGRYRIRVRIGHGRSAGTDLLDVLVTYPNPLVPFDTITRPDGASTPALVVGDQTVPSSGQAVTVSTLARSTTEVTGTRGFPGTSAGYADLGAYLDTLNNTQLVVLTVPGGQGFAAGSDLDAALAKIGANQPRSWSFTDAYCWTATPNKCKSSGSHWTSNGYGTGSFSVIGVPGMAVGQAWRTTAAQTGTTDGNLHGWLTRGQTDEGGYANQYTVVAGTNPYRKVETCAGSACDVTVGDQTFAAPTNVPNGLHVVVLNRVTLKPWVNTTVTSLNGLVGALETGWAPNPGSHWYAPPTLFDDQRLVVLQSVGTGLVTGTPNASVLALVDMLGATTETFVQSIDGKHAYALVGAPTNMPFHGLNGLESSTVMATGGPSPTRATGRLSGVIAPDRQMQYTPRSADPIGTTNNDLYPIAYQPAQAWPYAEDTDVLAYIADGIQLDEYPDIRSGYTDANQINSWGTYANRLSQMPCTGQSFCGAEFDAVRSELEQEFGWITLIDDLITNLQSVYTQDGSNPYFNVLAVMNAVKASVPPPPSAPTGMDVLGIITDALFVGDAVAGAAESEVEPIIGLLASSLSMTSDLVTTPDGEETSTIQATAEQLAADTSAQQTAAQVALDELQDILLSDYGRMHAVGTALTSDPTWRWDKGTDLPNAVDSLNATTRSNAYTALVPLSWGAFSLKPGDTEQTTNNPKLYVCKQGGDSVVGSEYPFAPATALSSLQVASAPSSATQTSGALYEAWVLADLPTWDYDHVQAYVAPDSLLSPIYGPDSTGPEGAFAYQPAWWHTTFPVPGWTVCNSSGNFNGNWSTHYGPTQIPLPPS